MLFAALARTALIYMAVLLVLFAWRHLSRRSMFALLAGAIVAASLIWTSSPYLRQRIADICHRISGAGHQRDRVDGAATDLLAQVDQVPCRGPACSATAPARSRRNLRAMRPGRPGWRPRSSAIRTTRRSPSRCSGGCSASCCSTQCGSTISCCSPDGRSRRGSGLSSSFKTSSAHS